MTPVHTARQTAREQRDLMRAVRAFNLKFPFQKTTQKAFQRLEIIILIRTHQQQPCSSSSRETAD